MSLGAKILIALVVFAVSACLTYAFNYLTDRDCKDREGNGEA